MNPYFLLYHQVLCIAFGVKQAQARHLKTRYLVSNQLLDWISQITCFQTRLKSGYKLIEIVGIDRKVQQAAYTTYWATEVSTLKF